jgi:hypothetical protein
MPVSIPADRYAPPATDAGRPFTGWRDRAQRFVADREGAPAGGG